MNTRSSDRETDRIRRSNPDFQTIRGYVMGFLIIGVAFAVFFRNSLNLDLSFLPGGPQMLTAFGVLCLIYGGWRVYLASKSNKADNDQ